MNGRQKFFELVREMRHAQKQYFCTRSPIALNKSKALEREVDEWIQRGQDHLDRQTPQTPQQ